MEGISGCLGFQSQNVVFYQKIFNSYVRVSVDSDTWNYFEGHLSRKFSHQMEKYAYRCNAILGIIKAHYNIVKTRPFNVNSGNINVIAMEPTHA